MWVQLCRDPLGFLSRPFERMEEVELAGPVMLAEFEFYDVIRDFFQKLRESSFCRVHCCPPSGLAGPSGSPGKAHWVKVVP